MPLPKTIAAYEDVRKVLDQIIRTNSPGTLTFETRKAAVRWRQRAYYYRTLVREDNARLRLAATSPYDNLVIRIVPESASLRIELESNPKIVGLKLDSPSGAAPDLNLDPVEDDDPVLTAALNFAKGLDNE